MHRVYCLGYIEQGGHICKLVVNFHCDITVQLTHFSGLAVGGRNLTACSCRCYNSPVSHRLYEHGSDHNAQHQ